MYNVPKVDENYLREHEACEEVIEWSKQNKLFNLQVKDIPNIVGDYRGWGACLKDIYYGKKKPVVYQAVDQRKVNPQHTHNKYGLKIETEYPNWARIYYSYNTQNDLKEEIVAYATGERRRTVYKYDKKGNLLQLLKYRNKHDLKIDCFTHKILYTYDAQNREIEKVIIAESDRIYLYKYDNAHNTIYEQSSVFPTKTRTFKHHANPPRFEVIENGEIILTIPMPGKVA